MIPTLQLQTPERLTQIIRELLVSPLAPRSEIVKGSCIMHAYLNSNRITVDIGQVTSSKNIGYRATTPYHKKALSITLDKLSVVGALTRYESPLIFSPDQSVPALQDTNPRKLISYKSGILTFYKENPEENIVQIIEDGPSGTFDELGDWIIPDDVYAKIFKLN